LGIVEEAGCRYGAAQTAPNQFKVTSECMVRHVGVARTQAIVKIVGDGEFEMTAEVSEGKKTYRASQVGRRRSDCPQEQGTR
jgi:hypothetical protein